jgi:D-glycero-D-manno-heptose 1,7-bisphosphate phosphatase
MTLPSLKNKAVFLDRDGTIIKEKHYLHNKSDVEFEEHAIEALLALHLANFKLFIVTNQSGIARGIFSEETFLSTQSFIEKQLKSKGIIIAKTYFCPHHPQKGIGQYKIDCSCRKPKPGMLLDAVKDFNINPDNAFMIGDKACDIDCGLSAGISPILVRTGYGIKQENTLINKPTYSANNLLDAANFILGKHL